MEKEPYIDGLECSVCHYAKCIFPKMSEYDYLCTVCGHFGYWGQEEMASLQPEKFSTAEIDDEPPFVSHAAVYVLSDPKYKDVRYIEDAEKLAVELKGTGYFGDVDESFFKDDTSAPERGTEEYRQWYDYCMAKGWYGIIGSSPVPENY